MQFTRNLIVIREWICFIQIVGHAKGIILEKT